MIKVMIVDDAKFMRLSIKRMLEGTNYEVVAEATNGEEAIRMHRIYMPDIITMDIIMPIMTGIEAVREIKAIDSNVKIVMASAMGQEPMVKEALIAGASSFIVKPFQKDRLLEVLNNAG